MDEVVAVHRRVLSCGRIDFVRLPMVPVYIGHDRRDNLLSILAEKVPVKRLGLISGIPCHKSLGYKFPGSNDCGEVAWYENTSSLLGIGDPDYGTHPVKTKKPNELGLYDMAGNIMEWCSDWYQKSFTTAPLVDPQGPETGAGRVLKGGSWGSNDTFCRPAGRQVSSVDKQYQGNGMRLVISASEIEGTSGK